MMRILKNRTSLLLGLSIALLVTACSTSSNVSTLRHPETSATLWMQNAAEYRALTTAVYQTATSNLGLAIEDSYWSAYPPQKDENYQQKAPAIIVDVDETVLDNSAYQARMIKRNKSFNPKTWNSWVMEAKAEAVPGALSFIKQVAEKNVAIYYVTNRAAKVEEGTRKNLRKLGFPLSSSEDHILSKNERKNWTSAKTDRRAFVADQHRILMLLGDNLNDFVSAENISQAKRAQLVEKHKNRWGRTWYMLPNPAYGSWEPALYNFDNSLSPSQIDSAKKANLDTKMEQ